MRRRTTPARARARARAPLFPRRLRDDPTFALWVGMSLLTAYPASVAPVATYLPSPSVRLALWFVGNYLLWRLIPLLALRAMGRLRVRVRHGGAVRVGSRHAVHPVPRRARKAGTTLPVPLCLAPPAAAPTAAGDAGEVPRPQPGPAARPVASVPSAAPARVQPRGMFEPEQPWVGPAATLTDACLHLVHPDLRATLRPAIADAVVTGMSYAVVEAGTTDLPPATPAWGMSTPDDSRLVGPMDDTARILAIARTGGYRWMRRPELDPMEVFGPAPHEFTA